MKDSNLWFREIMSIKLPNLLHKDLSKILLLFYILKNNVFNVEDKIINLNNYIYRFYSDNPELAKLHPSVIVNSITHYGSNDLLPFTFQALEEWKNDFPNGCLTYNEFFFRIDISDFSDNIINFTKNIADMLYMKAVNKMFNYTDELIELDEINNYDLDFINSTRVKNRVFENMQYCCCCDYYDDLYVINISNSIDRLKDISNYVMVCKKHYDLYKLGYFRFKENGRIDIIRKHSDLTDAMRISSNVLNNRKSNL